MQKNHKKKNLPNDTPLSDLNIQSMLLSYPNSCVGSRTAGYTNAGVRRTLCSRSVVFYSPLTSGSGAVPLARSAPMYRCMYVM